ncbi:MAG: DUF2779 domain-containing protein [Bacilli bacterium]|jgi:hypothetical protein
MKISKSRFINLSRCPRVAAMYELFDNAKDLDTLSTSEIARLARFERSQKLKEMYEILQSEDDDFEEEASVNALTNKVLELNEAKLLEIYNEIERLASDAVKEIFGGKVTYSKDTSEQKYFIRQYKNHEFYCFLDIFQEDEETIRVFEVKASTDSKLCKNLENKTEKSIYFALNDNNWEFNGDLAELMEKKAFVSRVTNRFGSDGFARQLFDINYQRFVIEGYYENKENNKPIEYYLILLNSEYIFDGVYKNGKPYYNPRDIVRFFNVTDIYSFLKHDFFETLDKTIGYIEKLDASITKLGPHCQRAKTRECEFLEKCFKDNNVPEVNSLFAYDQYHNGFADKSSVYDLIAKGITRVEDVPLKLLKNQKQRIQQKATITDVPFVEKTMIKYGLALLNYPIYHLDFETLNYPLPRFKGEKCYTQSPFQFSIHIEKEPGICDKNADNISFLASDNTKDERIELAKALVDTIKDDGGTILAYNSSFEQQRIEELSKLKDLDKEYRKKLDDFVSKERIFDLMHLVKGNRKIFEVLDELATEKEHYAKMYCYYNKDQSGSFSIKKVLPVFSDLSYKNMTIAKGTEASAAYNVFEQLDLKELQEVRNALLEYCKQDTWAMVLILEELRKLVK